MQSSARRDSGNHGQRRSLLGDVGRAFGVRRRRERKHDWPLALSDDEQGILTTLALKGYEAGESGVQDPNDNLHKVADGIVDTGLADKRSAAARRRRERADAIAAAPS